MSSNGILWYDGMFKQAQVTRMHVHNDGRIVPCGHVRAAFHFFVVAPRVFISMKNHFRVGETPYPLDGGFMMVYGQDHHHNGVFSCHVPLQVTVFTHITQ